MCVYIYIHMHIHIYIYIYTISSLETKEAATCAADNLLTFCDCLKRRCSTYSKYIMYTVCIDMCMYICIYIYIYIYTLTYNVLYDMYANM